MTPLRLVGPNGIAANAPAPGAPDLRADAADRLLGRDVRLADGQEGRVVGHQDIEGGGRRLFVRVGGVCGPQIMTRLDQVTVLGRPAPEIAPAQPVAAHPVAAQPVAPQAVAPQAVAPQAVAAIPAAPLISPPVPAFRRRLPDCRPCETHDLRFRNERYHVQIGPPGQQPLELFVQGPKTGADWDFLAKDTVTILSIALQHGVPAGAFTGRTALVPKPFPELGPEGQPVIGYEPATIIGALVDLLARVAAAAAADTTEARDGE